jgi:prepilin-type processing-associated H-X9-DG protein
MRWTKIAEVRDSAERGLVADCRFWLWESLSPGQGPSFPQNIAQQNSSGASFTWTAPSQTTVDIFRHGTVPGAAGTGSAARYDSSGGKIGYNVLYFDGHVAPFATGDEAYRAQRMRFPN